VGNEMSISAAVNIVTWNGPDGTPLSNVADYAQVLDFVCGLHSHSFDAVLTNFRCYKF
jgi:hypothetical protein